MAKQGNSFRQGTVEDADVRTANASKTTKKKQRMWAPQENLLEFPAELKEKFASEGYNLQWVRAMLGGKEDAMNLMACAQEGYEWVTTDELPVHLRDYYTTTNAQGRSDVVAIGDLILGKFPTEFSEQRNRHLARQAAEAERSAQKLWADSNQSREFRVIDDSTTRVETGREPD